MEAGGTKLGQQRQFNLESYQSVEDSVRFVSVKQMANCKMIRLGLLCLWKLIQQVFLVLLGKKRKHNKTKAKKPNNLYGLVMT